MKALKKYLSRRKAIAQLNRMSDAQLEDIGIPRYDIARRIRGNK